MLKAALAAAAPGLVLREFVPPGLVAINEAPPFWRWRGGGTGRVTVIGTVAVTGGEDDADADDGVDGDTDTDTDTDTGAASSATIAAAIAASLSSTGRARLLRAIVA